MVVSPGGEHFVGGYRDDSALVMRIDPNGGVVWAKTFRSGSPYRDLVNQLSITPDGYLIGTADSYGGSPITYRSIICFKFDTEGNPQWIRYSSGSQPFFSLATLPRSTSEYVLVDAPFDQSNDPFTDPMSHGISATDGSITWTGPRVVYTSGSSYLDDPYAAALGNGDAYYTTGRNYLDGANRSSMRSFISAFFGNGAHLWSRYHLVNGSANARIYGCDIIHDNDSLTVCYTGDIHQYSSNFRIGPIRTDELGMTAWARDYDLAGFISEVAAKVIRMPYGYLVTGRGTGADDDLFALAVSHEGHVLWAKRFGSNTAAKGLLHSYLKHATVSWTDLYLTGERTSGDETDLVLYRVDAQGNLDCGGSQDLIVTEVDAPLFSAPLEPELITDDLTLSPITAATWTPVTTSCPTLQDRLGPDTTTCSPLLLDASSTGATSFLWLDGSTNASFPANEPGTYWVSVVIDCCTSSDTVNISAATPPVAAFIITSEPCSLSALFENGSTGALTYAWQLRDGGTSAEENLSHEFSAPGPYTVLLIVSNACGSDTASQIVEIGVAAMFSMHGPSVI